VKTKKLAKQNNKKSQSIWFLLLGTALVTLYIQEDAQDPFNTPKLMVLILVAAWLSGYVLNNFRSNAFSKIKHMGFAFLIPIMFMLSLFISTLLTDVKIVGFIGDTQRRNGLLQYIALVIILIYTVINVNFTNSIQVYKTALLTGLVLSIYGFLQIQGRDLYNWNNPYNSMISTLGNPNFASAMLAIFCTLAVSTLFIDQVNKYYKFAAVTMSLLAIYDIFKSQSRQGFLVIVFALVFYVTVLIWLKSIKFGLLAVSFSLSLSLVLILGMLQRGPLQSLLYKDSLSVRGYYWRAAIEMFKSKPLTGVGVDRYGAYFNEYRESTYSLRYGFDITSSNAHNTFLQFFATSGIFVGITYLSLVAYIFIVGIKRLNTLEGAQQKILLGLLASWFGFQAQSLISIDNIGVSVWGWLLGGAVIALGRSSNVIEAQNLERNEPKNSNFYNNQIFQRTISFTLLVPSLVLSVQLMGSEKDTFLTRNYNMPENETYKQDVYNYANKVINNPLSDPQHKYIVSLALFDNGFQEEGYKHIKELVKVDPRNLRYLQGIWLIESFKQNKSAQIEVGEKILKYDPWNGNMMYELCKLYLSINQRDKATEIKNRLEDFAPNTEVLQKTIEILGQ
jgi:O-antigen ligase